MAPWPELGSGYRVVYFCQPDISFLLTLLLVDSALGFWRNRKRGNVLHIACGKGSCVPGIFLLVVSGTGLCVYLELGISCRLWAERVCM